MSYNYMDAGIASTILFVYPVMVAVIMGVFFKEKISAITVFSILLALSGLGLLYQEMVINRYPRWGHLRTAVFTFICYIHSRCEPLNIEKPANHQTYILRHPVRTIGLHRPSELLYGAAGYTIHLVMGRYIGFGYSANRHFIGLHRLSYPLYRLYTNRHSRCFGTCDSLIFRCYAVP